MKFVPLKSVMTLCSRIRNTTTSKLLARNLSGATELTRIRYPDVKRGNYSQLQNEDLVTFSDILDKNRVLTEESDLEGSLYLLNSHNQYKYYTWVFVLLKKVVFVFLSIYS